MYRRGNQQEGRGKFRQNCQKIRKLRKNTPPGGHETNVLTKFHEDWANNVSSRLFTCFHYIHIEKTAPPPGGHVFPPIMIIFELAKNVTSTVGHVFLPIRTIFKLNRHIQKTHVLTKFHEDWTKNVTSRVFTCFHYIHIEKTAPPTWRPYINETNVLTKFHDDWANIVTFRVNTASLTGGHVFQRTGTIFELNQHII
ncbi:hypothetical protein DPMN_090585 [Dreissena polymorpha]|uniref:Uncharacterized protein n=1 Tax=Dreissena polymorpha TaxID=45954 RepID=A0A9D4KYC0_DREPO|nr:hypothetical protein DPMN_090585 [Dreissena polymorpha]